MATPDEERFLASVHEEKMHTQAHRGALILRKLAWITGLLALGSIEFISTKSPINVIRVLYFIPIISVVFDLYIQGQDHSVKRIGTFVRLEFPNEPEGRWESSFIGKEASFKRDVYSRYALLISSVVVWLGCGLLLIADRERGDPCWVIGIWSMVCLLSIFYTHDAATKRLEALDAQEKFQHIQGADIAP